MMQIIRSCGRNVAVEADDPEIQHILTNFLSSYSESGHERAGDFDFVVRAWAGPEFQRAREEVLAETEPLLKRAPALFYTEEWSRTEEFLVLHGKYFDGEAIFAVNPSQGSAETWLKGAADAANWRFLNVPLLSALQLLLQYSGVHFIHAGGAARDGDCVILVGGSGQGKSTTTLQLVTDGYSFLSDDRLGIELLDSVRALSTPDWIGMLADSQLLFPKLAAPLARYGVATKAEGKIKAPVGRLFPGAIADTAVPKALCFLNRVEHEAISAEPLSKTEALQLLYQENGVAQDPILPAEFAQGQFAVYTKLIEQVQPYRLTYSISCLNRLSEIVDGLLAEQTN